MEIEAQIYSLLSAYAGITALMSATNIYPGEKAQDCALPAINFKSISKLDYPCMGSTPATQRNRVQVDVWATTQDSALLVARQVEACLDRYRAAAPIKVHDVFQLNTVNLGMDGESRQYHIAIDFEFHYDEQ